MPKNKWKDGTVWQIFQLAGLLLNLHSSGGRADPVAALIMASIIGNEGINASPGKRC
jgi:hypothetical protein